MEKREIQEKAEELNAILVKYKDDLGAFEKELLKAIFEYHNALKEQKLKEIKAGMMHG